MSATLESRSAGIESLAVFDEYYPWNAPDTHLERQRAGQRLLLFTEQDITGLLQAISTDGILPTAGGRFQKLQDLAPFALSGVGGISQGDLFDGGYNTIIVGDKFGGGSAREHAPRALLGTGVRTVIVLGNAERIFAENCLNTGLYVVEIPPNADALNMLLRNLREGLSSGVAEVYSDKIRPSIRQVGGLLEYTRRRMSGEVTLPIISHGDLRADHPMTAVEKILARAMVNIDPGNRIVIPGDVGFVKTDFRFTYEMHTKMIMGLLKEKFGDGIAQLLHDPKSIALFEDHAVLAHVIGDTRFDSLIAAQQETASALGITLYNNADSSGGSEGICHTLIGEKGLALSGDVIFGTDSHTCSAGLWNSYAVGGGATAMAAALLTKDILVEIPQSVRVELTGTLPIGCSAKDAMLTLLANDYVKDGGCIHKALEFVGDGLALWPVDSLFVLTNMAVEGGATTGILAEPIESVLAQLEHTTGQTREQLLNRFVTSDEGATYAHTIQIRLDDIEPMVATPGNPCNGTSISLLPITAITSAYIGSCTGGKLTDLREVAGVLKGNKVVVPLVVQAASVSIMRRAQGEGLLGIIRAAGGQVYPPGCGACIGLGPGSITKESDVVLSDTNRNFDGRMGKPEEGRGNGSVYLASPAVVAASSIAGFICSPYNG